MELRTSVLNEVLGICTLGINMNFDEQRFGIGGVGGHWKVASEVGGFASYICDWCHA